MSRQLPVKFEVHVRGYLEKAHPTHVGLRTAIIDHLQLTGTSIGMDICSFESPAKEQHKSAPTASEEMINMMKEGESNEKFMEMAPTYVGRQGGQRPGPKAK